MSDTSAPPSGEIEPTVSPAEPAAPAPAPAPQPKARRKARVKRDPLDHDADGRKGGVAEIPPVQHLVVLQETEGRDLKHGEVIGVDDATARRLLKGDVARPATPEDVELAQPRVRLWKEG